MRKTMIVALARKLVIALWRVSGTRRRRTPVALKTALASAAATGRIELSPAPAGGRSGRLISTMSTASGASVMSRIG